MKTKLLALLLVVVMAFAVTSCSLFNKGPVPSFDLEGIYDDYKEKDDWYARFEDDKEKLEPGVKQELRLTEYDDEGDMKSYVSITEYADKDYAKIAYKQLKDGYAYQIESYKLQIEEYEYILENYAGDLEEEEEDEIKDELDDLRKELVELEEEMSFGMKDNFVWQGHITLLEKLAED